jgi:hypothetical protein
MQDNPPGQNSDVGIRPIRAKVSNCLVRLLDRPHPASSLHSLAELMMKLVLLASLVVSSVLAARETVQEAALSARNLLHNESILTLSSIFTEDVNPSLAGQPFAYFLAPQSNLASRNTTLIVRRMATQRSF